MNKAILLCSICGMFLFLSVSFFISEFRKRGDTHTTTLYDRIWRNVTWTSDAVETHRWICEYSELERCHHFSYFLYFSLSNSLSLSEDYSLFYQRIIIHLYVPVSLFVSLIIFISIYLTISLLYMYTKITQYWIIHSEEEYYRNSLISSYQEIEW